MERRLLVHQDASSMPRYGAAIPDGAAFPAIFRRPTEVDWR